MFNLFNKNQETIPDPKTPVFLLKSLQVQAVNFDGFTRGIDNVHVDVHLSSHFIQLSQSLIKDLLEERSSTKRRFSDKPSAVLCEQLEAFNGSYASMLTAALHRAREDKALQFIQLFQLSVMKFVLNTVQTKAEQLLYELRKLGNQEDKKSLELSERIRWIHRNYNNLIYQVNYELFEQLHWVEMGPLKSLRESLLGVSWSISEEMMFNPLLYTPDIHHHEVVMRYYVLLSQDPDSSYGFDRLSSWVDMLLEDIGTLCPIQLIASSDHILVSDNQNPELSLSWKDVTDNVNELLDAGTTQRTLEELSTPNPELSAKLQCQQKAYKLFEQQLRQAQLLPFILAAYSTPQLYEHYAKLLKPYLIFQTLCGELEIKDFAVTLQNQQKLRPLRRQGDKQLSADDLIRVKKQLQKLAKQPISNKVLEFLKGFIAYRRDKKFHQLIQEGIADIHLVNEEADVQLSRANGLLHEFLEQNEYTNSTDSIRCHVILKADLRGSTTITAELCKRGLNPATHFSRNFFNPIRQLIEDFGAEKVFIEGDAVILSIFEYHNAPEQWLATARACGLAQSMLQVVQVQNQFCRAYNLPILELGIGICYAPHPPQFLYDGNQRIMISPAIGDADRLSSCSWKLRQKYANSPHLLTNVMVFQQPPTDHFKGEKGMTTFRYNLNGIELDAAAFKKLQKEIALRQIDLTLTGDSYPTAFYLGNYSNAKGETQEVIIREGRIQIWQDQDNYYPPTDTFYYEVVSHKEILNLIKHAFLK